MDISVSLGQHAWCNLEWLTLGKNMEKLANASRMLVQQSETFISHAHVDALHHSFMVILGTVDHCFTHMIEHGGFLRLFQLE